MNYINTSHPNFIGGSKAVEIALQQVKSSRVSLPISRQKVKEMNGYLSFSHVYIYTHIIIFKKKIYF